MLTYAISLIFSLLTASSLYAADDRRVKFVDDHDLQALQMRVTTLEASHRADELALKIQADEIKKLLATIGEKDACIAKLSTKAALQRGLILQLHQDKAAQQKHLDTLAAQIDAQPESPLENFRLEGNYARSIPATSLPIGLLLQENEALKARLSVLEAQITASQMAPPAA